MNPDPALQPYRARDLVRVPGLLSLCRLPLAAVFPFCVGRPALALGVLAAAAASDVLDGWYARRFHQETRTGALLDGVMDKVFVLTVLGTLLVTRSITIIQILLLGARELGELALIATALVLRPRPLGSHRSASFLGKLATVLQFATVVLVIVRAPYVSVAVAVTAACGALAAGAYWRSEWTAPR
ncbi:MAG TPA: CDP-alcohol phosphatidyltransferase family protein [Polyangiaceae bacterium]